MKKTKKEFEKLWLYLKDKNFSYSNIAVANCPDNWNRCSIVAYGVYENGTDRFISLIVNKEEALQIRDALTQVIRDMNKED